MNFICILKYIILPATKEMINSVSYVYSWSIFLLLLYTWFQLCILLFIYFFLFFFSFFLYLNEIIYCVKIQFINFLYQIIFRNFLLLTLTSYSLFKRFFFYIDSYFLKNGLFECKLINFMINILIEQEKIWKII